MSLSESKTSYDGFTTITRGVDSGRAASLIGVDQVAFAVNTTFRNGYPRSRPGISQIDLSGDDFQLGKWQGAHAYQPETGRGVIIASIGGQIIRFDPTNGDVVNLSTLSGLSNNPNLDQTWMTQAEIYMPIQNNSQIPLIFDGAGIRRANPVAFGGTELPVGNVMEYNNSRLWVALDDRRSFVGGDLAYSITGTAADVLSFTENQFINGGGSFALPSDAGFIRSMRSLAIQDSTLGQGPLQVFGDFGTATVSAPFDRTLWQNTDSPIQSVGLVSAGPRSQDATINVNGDLWFRANDGIRSFMVARRDHGTWVNTPLSHEMDRVLNRDDQYLLGFASAVNFDNRLLMTASPYRATETDGTEHGIAHRGLVVLDFNPTTSMFSRGQPMWEGIWTGLQILQVVTVKIFGIDRCFIFSINASYDIELWELSTDALFDNLDTPIEWIIETRSMGFKDQSETLKQLQRTERWLTEVAGTVTMDIKYRPDGFWGWIELDSGSVCATTGVCSLTVCTPPSFPQLQYRPRKLSAAPGPDCEECASKPYRNGFEYQFKITMTGASAFRRFRAVATEVAENTTGGCLGEEVTCCEQLGCESSPWDYVIVE